MGVLSFLFICFYFISLLFPFLWECFLFSLSLFTLFFCLFTLYFSFSFLLSLCTFLFRWYFVLVRVNQVMGFYKVFIIKSVKGEFIQWGMQLREMK